MVHLQDLSEMMMNIKMVIGLYRGCDRCMSEKFILHFVLFFILTLYCFINGTVTFNKEFLTLLFAVW